MTDQIGSPLETIFKISIGSVSHLPFQKKELVSSVSVTFDGETRDSDIVKGKLNPSFDFVVDYKREFNEDFLSRLFYSPLIVSVYEDKNKMCTYQLPLDDILIEGEESISGVFAMECTQGSVPQNEQPQVEIEISLSAPLYQLNDFALPNVFTISVQGAYSLPSCLGSYDIEPWLFRYFLTVDLPGIGGNRIANPTFEGFLSVPGKPISETQSISQSRHSLMSLSGYNQEIINPVTTIFDSVLKNDLESENDLYKEAEQSKPFIKFTSSSKYFVSPLLSKQWRSAIETKTLSEADFHFFRVLSSEFEEYNDQNAKRTMASIKIPLSSLVNIGNRFIEGRFKFSPMEINEESLSSNQITLTNESSVRTNSANSRTRQKRSGSAGERKRTTQVRGKTKRTRELDFLLNIDSDNFPYESENTYLIASLSFQKPLVLRPSTPNLRYSPRDFIPPRRVLPMYDQLQDVRTEFFAFVRETIDFLANEYHKHFDESGDSLSSDELQNRRNIFVSNFIAEGSYNILKSQFKAIIMKIIREKYLKASNSLDQSMFINSLFVYLIDQLNFALENKSLSTSLPDPFSQSDCGFELSNRSHSEKSLSEDERCIIIDRLGKLGFDAINVGNLRLAKKKYRERIAFDKTNPLFWYELGVVYLRLSKLMKAKVCFCESLDQNNSYIKSLLLLGVMSIDVDNSFTEICFTKSVFLSPKNTNAGSLLWFFYEHTNQTEKQLKIGILCEKETFHSLILFLLDVNLTVPAEILISKSILLFGPNAFTLSLIARMYLCRENYPRAEYYSNKSIYEYEHPQNADEVSPTAYANAYQILGEVYYSAEMVSDSFTCFQKAHEINPESKQALLFMRLGELSYRTENYNESAKFFLKAVRCADLSQSKPVSAWLGVSKAELKAEKWNDCELALSEASTLDSSAADVWGYFTVLYLKTNRDAEAEKAFEQSLRLRLNDFDLLKEIGISAMDIGALQMSELSFASAIHYEKAKSFFIANSHRLYGDCLFRQEKFEKAIAEYKLVVELTESNEEDYQHAQARIESIQTEHSTG